MNALASKSLQLPLMFAALAAILCGAVAFSLLTASSQASVESPGQRGAPGKWPEAQPPSAIEAQAQAPRTNRVRARCAECGVIESTREIETRSEATGAGAPGRIYEAVVRLQDGSTHVINDVSPGRWRPGERVKLIAGMQ